MQGDLSNRNGCAKHRADDTHTVMSRSNPISNICKCPTSDTNHGKSLQQTKWAGEFALNKLHCICPNQGGANHIDEKNIEISSKRMCHGLEININFLGDVMFEPKNT